MGRISDTRPHDAEPLVSYDIGSDESLSDAVLHAAGAVIDDLTDVWPLSSTIDVDALDNLFEAHRMDGRTTHIVSFAAWGLWFVVTPATVEIYEMDSHPDS